MTEQNIQETPQVEQPRNELGQFSPADSMVDDVIFGTRNPEELVQPVQGEEQSAPVEGQPDVHLQPEIPQTAPDATTTTNDEVRYQYWQSQADKAKNESEQLKQNNQLLQNQLNVITAQQQQAPEQEQKDEFPPPPERPSRPTGFNREEAYTDSNSVSAQYLDSIDNWRDDMNEYNSLHTQYQAELVKTQQMDFENKQRYAEEQRQIQMNETRQLDSVAQHVRTTYNASDHEVNDFIGKFSSDESITIDNLWRLYQMEKGGQAPANPAPKQPSAVFEQTKRAQQVPSPMGVVTGASEQAQGSIEDRMMDTMVTDYKSQNPF